MSTLNERDMGVLAELEAACRNHAKYGYLDGWARPLDCGGSNGSDHSYRLSKLAKVGAAEAKQRMPWAGRGSKVYRITDAGLALLSSRNTKGSDHE